MWVSTTAPSRLSQIRRCEQLHHPFVSTMSSKCYYAVESAPGLVCEGTCMSRARMCAQTQTTTKEGLGVSFSQTHAQTVASSLQDWPTPQETTSGTTVK